MKPKVACVLPICESELLGLTLHSLLHQNRRTRIYVYTDADNIYRDKIKIQGETLDAIIKKHPARFVRLPSDTGVRRGAAYGRNLGISQARKDGYDIVAVCDAGDIYYKNRIEYIQEFFTKFPEYTVFSHQTK